VASERTQPEQGAFSAADLMRNLAEVSGEGLTTVAPDLAASDAVVLAEQVVSPVDIAQQNYQNELDKPAERADRVLEFLVSKSVSLYKRYEELEDDYDFEEAINPLVGIVDEGLIQLIINDTEKLIQMADLPDLPQGLEDGALIGVWLSVMANAVPEKPDNDSITQIHLVMPDGFKVNKLGYRLRGRRELKIDGDVGDDVGTKLEGGFITVNGNAGDDVGSFMNRGSIVVNGDVEDNLGWKMHGGELSIKGKAGSNIAYLAEAGLIHIHKETLSHQIDLLHNSGTVNVISGDVAPFQFLVKDGKAL
jgi:hypothetical protein